MKLLLLILMLPSFLYGQSTQPNYNYTRNNVVYTETFEGTKAQILDATRVISDTCSSCTHAINLIDTAYYGKGAMRFRVLSTDSPYVNQSYRADIIPWVATREYTEVYGSSGIPEGWFGVSILVPSYTVSDPDGEIITDFHDSPDIDLGEPYKAAAVQLSMINGRYVVRVAWDTAHLNLTSTLFSQLYDLGAVQTDVWTNWVYHVKWSYTNTGILEIWKDGVKVISRINQPNSFNDDSPPYWKVGIYKYSWGFQPTRYYQNPHYTTQRTIIVDEMRAGNKNATYNDVAPSKIPGIKLKGF